MLFVVCCSLFDFVRCMLLVVCCMLRDCCWLLVYFSELYVFGVVHCLLLFVVCCLLVDVCCLLCVVRWWCCVGCCSLLADSCSFGGLLLAVSCCLCGC